MRLSTRSLLSLAVGVVLCTQATSLVGAQERAQSHFEASANRTVVHTTAPGTASLRTINAPARTK